MPNTHRPQTSPRSRTDVDKDGEGVPGDAGELAARNFSNSERQQLATLYQPGQSLWRMPLQHFSDEDFNASRGIYGFGGFSGPGPAGSGGPGCSDTKTGSIIECQTQNLGERVDVIGTPYSLNYRSSRQIGRRPNYRLHIPRRPSQTVSLPRGLRCFP